MEASSWDIGGLLRQHRWWCRGPLPAASRSQAIFILSLFSEQTQLTIIDRETERDRVQEWLAGCLARPPKYVLPIEPHRIIRINHEYNNNSITLVPLLVGLQDIAVVPLLVILPVLESQEDMATEKEEYFATLPVPNVQDLSSNVVNEIPDRYIRPEFQSELVCDDDSFEIPVIDFSRILDERTKLHTA
ncbi:hypothetical protein Scep_026883 [Stephania cephalantha]|uniref:Uncharacterized protein n=1 Tax=Stephania cephalantha TaxID=152367 RepID=A0AAP0HQW6_9MAGN